ncbi:MAG: fimbria/pilus outer membrane usher protein [Hyphomonadaceae bacterium]
MFASRTANGVEAPGSALAQLGIAAPNTDDLVPLSSITGLSYEELPDESAIVITCTMSCFERQRLDMEGPGQAPPLASGAGGYLNYEAEARWIEDSDAEISGIAEAALFGSWGLIESSWLGRSGVQGHITRLETSWTVDRPLQGVRARFGDSVMIGATGTPMRFGGIQIGRHFGLTPSLITYPTLALSGEAETASTIELYVDGVLRARTNVAAGPFVIDHAPVVSGGGEAELIVTDVLGRQQTITRPFFVNTLMLRPGFSDWSVAIGAERRRFGFENARYGDTFAAVRYRRGLADALTIEGAIEATDELATLQGGASVANPYFGQAYISHAYNTDGDYTSASWYYDGRVATFGLQLEQRGGAFTPLGQDGAGDFRRAVAGNAAFDLGDNGAISFTAAEIEFNAAPRARTLTFSYTPDYADGAISFRLIHTARENEDEELAAGVSFSFSLTSDVSGHARAEHDRHGITYRASAQRAVEPDRLGWRVRAAAGATDRLEAAAIAQSAMGDTIAEVGFANGISGARARHRGSVGWIDDIPFAGRHIDGAFAVVDGGAPNVSVARNHLNLGETGADGRRLITNLQPYRVNTISIDPNDLPIDRAPATPSQRIAIAEGGGAVVRFVQAQQRIIETRVVFADGSPPPRGAVLVRERDQRRFPIGSNGRITLQGAESGDVLSLGSCVTEATEPAAAAAAGLVLTCGAMS